MNALLQCYPGDRAAVLAAYVLAEVTILVALACVVARRMARGRPAVRYGVWLCALACVMLSPLTTLLLDRAGLAVWTVPVLRDAPEPLVEVVAARDTASAERRALDPTPFMEEGRLLDASLAPSIELQLNSQGESAAATSQAPAAAAQSSSAAPAPLSRAEGLRAGGGAVVAVWLAGIAFFLIRFVRGWWIVAALRRDAKPITDVPVLEVLDLVRRRLGLVRLPRVVTSRQVAGPVVVGVVRPMVILPEVAIPTMGPQQLRDVLVHECAHVVRRDHWVSLLQRLIEMLFWPHVLVHYLNRQLSRAREEVCDNYVLGSGDAPGYARTLLTFAEHAALRRATPAGIGLLQPRWRLEDRVAGLLDTRRDLMLRMSRCGVGAVVVAFLAVTVLVAGTRLTRSAADASEPPAEDRTVTTQPRNAEVGPTVEVDDDSVVVHGRVLDPDGKPLGGVTVRAQTPLWAMLAYEVGNDASAPVSQVKTDAEGRFTVSFGKQPFGDLSRLDQRWQDIWKKTLIVAVESGYGPAWIAYEDIDPDETISLRLVRDVPVKGRVVDLEGQPIAGAHVKLGDVYAAQDEDISAWLEAARAGEVPWTIARLTPKQIDVDLVNVPESITTDEEGRFEIHGIGRDRHVELVFGGEGVAHRSVTVVTRPMEPFDRVISPAPFEGSEQVFGAEFTFSAAPSRPVEGTVVDAETGEPLAGVAVESYKLADYPYSNHRVLKTTTDKQGRFRLTGMPKAAGNLLLVVPNDELPYFMQQVGVPNPAGIGPATVEVRLHRGIWITGRVTDKATGKPVLARLHYLPLRSNKFAQAIPEFDDNGNTHGDQTRYQTRDDGTYRLVGLPGRAIVGAQSLLREYRFGVGADEVVAPKYRNTDNFDTYRNPGIPGPKWPNVMREINPPADAESVQVDFEMDPGSPANVEAKATPKPESSQSSAEGPAQQPRPSPAPSIRNGTSPSHVGKAVTVRGLVLDPDNKPLVEAHVAAIAMRVRTVRGGDLGSSGDVLAQGTTDDNGRYELTLKGVTSSTHQDARLIVRKDHFGVGWHNLSLDATTNDSLLTLTPEEPIRGRLIDIEGQPASGVRLLIRSVMAKPESGRLPGSVGFRSATLPAAWLAPVTSDEQGRFTIHGVPADHGVWLDVDGGNRFAAQSIALNTGIAERRGERDGTYRPLVKNANPGEDIVLALSPAQIFEGVVTYEDTGEPAAHARLTIWASQQQQFGSMIFVAGKADAEGHYRISAKPGIRFGVTAYPPDGVPYLTRQTPLSKAIRWNAGDLVKRVDVSVPRGVLVRGHVREAGSGAPVAGASIQYHPERANNPNVADDILTGWEGIQLSDKDGRFEIAVLPGPGRLLVHGPNGQYVLEEVGGRQIYQGKPGGERYYAHAVEEIEPAPDAEVLEINLDLTRGASIVGRVVDEQGDPINEVLVITRLKISPSAPFWRGHTRPTFGGRFEIEGAEEGEEYPVYFLDPKRQLGATAMLKADGREATVVLRPCGRANLRFVDTDGKPVAENFANVRMVVTPGPHRFDGAALRSGALAADSDFIGNIDRTNYATWTKSDAQGELSLPAIIPGATYRIIIRRGQQQEIAREFQGRANETLELGDIVVETAPAS